MYYKLLSTVLLLVIIFTGCEKKQEKVEEKAKEMAERLMNTGKEQVGNIKPKEKEMER